MKSARHRQRSGSTVYVSAKVTTLLSQQLELGATRAAHNNDPYAINIMEYIQARGMINTSAAVI